MKKIFFILIPLFFLGFLAGKINHPLKGDFKETETLRIENTTEPDVKKVLDKPSERVKQTLNCKSCHAAEYPTINDPGLLDCPRTDMISVYHSPEEGPETVIIDGMTDYYYGVVFSHRDHAKMSEMSDGCTGCHHYNTTGPVLSCRKCHDNERSRDEISLPDLKAAYHRQCMTCHKQWSNENGCNNQCHTRRTTEKVQMPDDLKGRSIPKLSMPVKLVWQTKSRINKTVTFFHQEHIQLFKINCKSCHSQESCIKCHSSKNDNNFDKLIKNEKTIEEHHKPCINCHYGDQCLKCHQEKEMLSFDHARSSGWSLNPYHGKLECTQCHGSNMPYKKLSNKCASCHKNFTSAFDHKLIGFVFSESHRELECNNCHLKDDFSKTPACTECHDDKSYPKDKPGTKR